MTRVNKKSQILKMSTWAGGGGDIKYFLKINTLQEKHKKQQIGEHAQQSKRKKDFK